MRPPSLHQSWLLVVVAALVAAVSLAALIAAAPVSSHAFEALPDDDLSADGPAAVDPWVHQPALGDLGVGFDGPVMPWPLPDPAPPTRPGAD